MLISSVCQLTIVVYLLIGVERCVRSVEVYLPASIFSLPLSPFLERTEGLSLVGKRSGLGPASTGLALVCALRPAYGVSLSFSLSDRFLTGKV